MNDAPASWGPGGLAGEPAGVASALGNVIASAGTVREVIFHIALPSDWQAAQVSGDYRISTRGRSLAEVGFIHASRRGQVLGVAEAFYSDAGPLLLLTIDPARLSAPLRDDEVSPGIVFPHIYGPLDLDAVVSVDPLERDADGNFVMPSAD